MIGKPAGHRQKDSHRPGAETLIQLNTRIRQGIQDGTTMLRSLSSIVAITLCRFF
jgi:hypothetical protein